METIKEELEQLMLETNIAGLSAAVITEECTDSIYLGRLGKLTPYSEIPVQPGIFYDLASLTKVIGTTTRILQLIDSTRIALSSRCSDILTEFPNLTMTIEELLLHHSGLIADFKDKSHFSEELLRDYLHLFEKPQFSTMVYSDIGYLLLGLIIERLDKKDLQTSFQEYIFRPLRLKHTTYFLSEADCVVPTELSHSRGLIVGKVHDSKAFLWGRPAGNAGLFSTLADVVRFSRCLMMNEDFVGKQLISKRLYCQLQTQDCNGRTLGWAKPFAGTILYHTGFTGTAIGIDLKKKRGLILLTNRIHPDRENNVFLEKRLLLYKKFFEESPL